MQAPSPLSLHATVSSATISSAVLLAAAPFAQTPQTAPPVESPDGPQIWTVLSESDVLPVSGDTDTDPSCLAVLPDGDLIYVDTDPGTDTVFHWDAQTEVLSPVVAEAALGQLDPAGPTGVVAFESVVVDAAQNILLLIGDASSPTYTTYVVRVPFTGVGNGYGGALPELYAQFAPTEGYVQQMTLDPVLSQLVFLRDTDTSTGDTQLGPGANGVYSVSLFLPPPLPLSILSQVSTFTGLAAQLTPQPVLGTEDIGFQNLVVGQGFAYLACSETSSGNSPNFDLNAGEGYEGDIVRVSLSTGLATPFLDRAQFLADTNAALGLNRGPGSPLGELNLLLDADAQRLYVFEDLPHSAVPVGVTGGPAVAESIVAYDSLSGAFLGVVAHNASLRSHYAEEGSGEWPSQTNTTFTLANLPMALGPDGDIYVFFVNVDELCLRIRPFAGEQARPRKT